ncbi:hypothetical protein AX15_003887 [Amanita polypyramis BW_CC]|nr:hypothetical protein AX15_003887 [Amanita polypyramis BW_CC]
MPRFLLGDELGHIKSLRYPPDPALDVQEKALLKIMHSPDINPAAVQSLAVSSAILTAAFSNGSTSAFHLHENDTLEELATWIEPRLKDQQKFVGLSVSTRAVVSCTSNGALRMVTLPYENADLSSQITALPTRLRDWKLSVDETKFAYGGDEVELSVWNTERAFQIPKETVEREEESRCKKRKRNDVLFPAEIWRAKNVANDGLGLRQPVRITSLAFLDSTLNATNLLAGTELGDARRYDTRASRRPVAEFKAIGRLGGVKVLEKGANENEVFIGDNGSSLFSVDLRNGKIVYGYKGLSGSVNSIATTPKYLATAALDRFARIHSVEPPPERAGQQQNQKGQVLEKVFTKSIPTSIVWDEHSHAGEKGEDEDEDDDEIWTGMQHVGDESEPVDHGTSKHKRRKA